MNLLFLGPPGAGKGTQAKLIEERFGLRQLSSGDMLRDAVAKGSAVGKAAQDYMSRGALVPDEVVLGIVFEHIKHARMPKGFMLDGFPRTQAQAEALDALLPSIGRAIDKVLVFDVDDQLLIDRVEGRYTCTHCGEGYHHKFKPPRVAGTCDKCGHHDFKRRADDNAETMAHRLAVYHAETRPLIAYYQTQGKAVIIDGTAPIETVTGIIDDIFAADAA